MNIAPYLPQTDTSVTIRLELINRPGMLAKVISAIGDLDGNIGAIDIVQVRSSALVRDITIDTRGASHVQQIADAISEIEGVELVNISDRTFLLHLGGKIEVNSKVPINSRDRLSRAYTPGVARVCQAIADKPDSAYTLTIKSNTIAVVTDGSAVLGMGDIGPAASLPVMEGKAQLLKEFADVDGFPICLNTQDVDEVVETVANIATGFGGINLEDISAPRCFEIEDRLKERLDIPVFHDDQHGTAVVTTAAFINALKVVDKKPEDLKVVTVGIGAAGTAVTRMLLDLGVENIIGFDREGAVARSRDDLNEAKRKFAQITNPNNFEGGLEEGMKGADVFIGLSGPGVLSVDDLKAMADGAIVFAMANPVPEIMPELAYPIVDVMATGRSDYPNQINNVLCFPGMFKGALSCRATDINEPMKMAAAYAIAETIDQKSLAADYIVPSVFDHRVVDAVADAVVTAAVETGVARKDAR